MVDRRNSGHYTKARVVLHLPPVWNHTPTAPIGALSCLPSPMRGENTDSPLSGQMTRLPHQFSMVCMMRIDGQAQHELLENIIVDRSGIKGSPSSKSA